MYSTAYFSRFNPILALTAAFLLGPLSPAQAQATKPEQTSAQAQPASVQPQGMKANSLPKPVDETPNQLELLRRKVEQLEALVERQQLSLSEMQKQLAEIKDHPMAVLPAFIAQPAGASTAQPRDGILQPGASPAGTSASAESQAKDQKTVPIIAGWDGNHAFLHSADGNFETSLTGFAQLDFRGYSAGTHPANTLLLRRGRLALEGKLFRYFDYKVEGDFADTAGTILRDAYIRIHRVDPFQLTFGHFKEPFSQEELRSDTVQDFVERSLVNNLAPSRSPGLMASGVWRKGVVEYQLGAFNGKGLLAPNNTGTPESVLRLRFAPWKNSQSFWVKGLAFGGATAYGRSSGGTSVRGQTESRSISFFVPDTVNGKIVRANGEVTWLLGPAAFRAEYDQTNQERHGLGARGTSLPGVVAKGYVGQLTYLLTGENKPDAGAVNPKHNLFGDERGRRGWGAWELKFRYSNLRVSDATAKSNRAESFYFGPNWYLNKFVRYVLDLGIERFKDPLRTPKPGDNNFFVVLSRIQVTF